jgi:hypothetical protein
VEIIEVPAVINSCAEFGSSIPGTAFADDFPGRGIESCEERGRSVAGV